MKKGKKGKTKQKKVTSHFFIHKACGTSKVRPTIKNPLGVIRDVKIGELQRLKSNITSNRRSSRMSIFTSNFN